MRHACGKGRRGSSRRGRRSTTYPSWCAAARGRLPTDHPSPCTRRRAARDGPGRASGRRLPVGRRDRMSLHNLMQWMADTEWSVGLHESRYAYSIIESIHVWTLCLFVGFAVLLDLRLLGVTLRRVPVSQIATRLLPWTKAAFVVMVISGVLLFYAIPLRTYHNVFFRAKAVFLLLAGLNAWLFHS